MIAQITDLGLIVIFACVGMWVIGSVVLIIVLCVNSVKSPYTPKDNS